MDHNVYALIEVRNIGTADAIVDLYAVCPSYEDALDIYREKVGEPKTITELESDPLSRTWALDEDSSGGAYITRYTVHGPLEPAEGLPTGNDSARSQGQRLINTHNVFVDQDWDLIVEKKRAFYSRFDLAEFQRSVEEFWSKPLAKDPSAVAEEVKDLVSIGDEFCFPFSWDEYLPATDFWRVRKVSADTMRNGLTVADLWEAPKEFVPAGRLNQPEQPLLYTCMGNPAAPMREAGLEPDDIFILIWYRLHEPIQFKRIGVTNTDPALTAHEQHIEEALSTFIRDVLTIPASHEHDALYSLTQRVLESFFPIDHVNDGWIFKSTLMPDADNAVIVPANAHTKLSVKNVLAAQFISADDLTAVYHAFSDGVERIGDKIGLQKFPQNDFNGFQEILDWVDQY